MICGYRLIMIPSSTCTPCQSYSGPQRREGEQEWRFAPGSRGQGALKSKMLSCLLPALLTKGLILQFCSWDSKAALAALNMLGDPKRNFTHYLLHLPSRTSRPKELSRTTTHLPCLLKPTVIIINKTSLSAFNSRAQLRFVILLGQYRASDGSF